MNKCFRLIVFGSLLSVAALNANGDGANLGEGQTPSKQETPSDNPPKDLKDGGDGKDATPGGILSKFTISALTDYASKHPYRMISTGAILVGALAVWKCSWVRKQLGLEEDDKDLRSQDFDFEAIMNQAKRK